MPIRVSKKKASKPQYTSKAFRLWRKPFLGELFSLDIFSASQRRGFISRMLDSNPKPTPEQLRLAEELKTRRSRLDRMMAVKYDRRLSYHKDWIPN